MITKRREEAGEAAKGVWAAKVGRTVEDWKSEVEARGEKLDFIEVGRGRRACPSFLLSPPLTPPTTTQRLSILIYLVLIYCAL
jgi:hypothetical protein